jgi:uncharacterized protein (DUF427 family)
LSPAPGKSLYGITPVLPGWRTSQKHIQIIFNGVIIADTKRAKRVLETSHPPTYYIPPEDIKMEYLTGTSHTTWCEWKGKSRYYNLKVGDRQEPEVAWSYPTPTSSFATLKDYVAFYPGRMDDCFVDGEKVQAQAVIFMEGGSPVILWGLLRVEPVPGAGNRYRFYSNKSE